MDVAFKLLVEHYSSFQVVFLRSAMSLPFFVGWIIATDRARFRTAYFGGHLLRGALGIVMLYAVGECFRELHLADAYTLFFAAPLVITLLSGPVLGLLGMLAYAFSSLLLRRLGGRDGTVTIAFWFVALVCAGSAVLAIPQWRPIAPEHWPHIVLLGLTGACGQALLTAAFRRASAAVVAPFDYTHMVWALVYGLAFWGYVPGWRVRVGAAVIVLSGLYILLRERRQTLRQHLS